MKIGERKRGICIRLAILLAITNASAEQAVRVRTDRVNLRARPDMSAEVVVQSPAGTILQVLSDQGEWLEVAAPDFADVWAYREFVKDGVVTVNRLNLRAGPGINFSVVGVVTSGQSLAVRGQFGEWLKVAPTNVALWVRRELTEPVPASPAPAPPPVMPPAASDASDRQSATETAGRETSLPVKPLAPAPVAIVPAVPSDLKLVPLEGQGRAARYEGELRQTPFQLFRPSDFRLVRREGVQIITLCYVRGNYAQLKSLLNERLILYGREYWVQGVRRPVLVLERIERPAP